MEEIKKKHFQDLQNFGFSKYRIESVYEKFSGDFEQTLNYLLENNDEENLKIEKKENNNFNILQWEELNIDNPKPRNSHCCSLYKHQLYMFGGQDHPKKFSDLNVFNFQTKQWKEIFDDTSQVGGPSARSHTACCFIGDYFYIFAGEAQGDYNLDDAYVLNINTMKWKEVKFTGCELPKIGSHSLVVRNGNIYVIGGYDRSTGNRNEKIIKYELISDDLLEGTVECQIPVAITYFGSCLLYDRLYLFGGWIKGPSKGVFEYDFQFQKWKQLSDMPFGDVYANFSFSTPYKNYIICYGGSNRESDFNCLYEYHPIIDKFILIKDNEENNEKAPKPSFYPCVCMYQNLLLVFSGYLGSCLKKTNIIKLYEISNERIFNLFLSKKALDVHFSFK